MKINYTAKGIPTTKEVENVTLAHGYIHELFRTEHVHSIFLDGRPIYKLSNGNLAYDKEPKWMDYNDLVNANVEDMLDYRLIETREHLRGAIIMAKSKLKEFDAKIEELKNQGTIIKAKVNPRPWENKE